MANKKGNLKNQMNAAPDLWMCGRNGGDYEFTGCGTGIFCAR